jgi:DNA replication protein DnaC
MSDPLEKSIAKLSTLFKAVPIEEHEQRLALEQGRKLQEHSNKVSELIASAGIPKRHKCATINPDGEWGSTYQKLNQNLSTGFLSALIGTRGNGKTQIGVELVKSNAERLKTSRFCCATEFFMDIKASYRKEGVSEKDVIKDYLKPSLLVMDEIGQRSDSEWENRLLFYLVNERYEDLKDTLFIGNLEPSQLVTALGPSIASRMNEAGGIIQCNWESFRN